MSELGKEVKEVEEVKEVKDSEEAADEEEESRSLASLGMTFLVVLPRSSAAREEITASRG